jgi:hypothetical protein
MENKGIICCVGIVIVFILALVLLGMGGDDTTTTDYTTDDSTSSEPQFYSATGKVKPKSSSLILYYNNDASIYGYYNSDNEFLGQAYYNDASIKGKIKINLNKVKWTDGDVDHAESFFVDDFKAAYDDSKSNIDVDIDVVDKKGKGVDLYTISTGDDDSPIKISLKKNILTIKVKHTYNVKKTRIENAPDYAGDLAKEPADFNKAYKAKVTISLSGTDYSYTITSNLKGNDFYL